MSGPNVYEEHRIVITWTVGDSLAVDPGDLDEWEVRAALEKAIDLVAEDENHEADVAGD